MPLKYESFSQISAWTPDTLTGFTWLFLSLSRQIPGQLLTAGHKHFHFLSNPLFINHTKFLQQISVSSNITWIWEGDGLKLGLADAVLNVDKEQDGKKVGKNDMTMWYSPIYWTCTYIYKSWPDDRVLEVSDISLETFLWIWKEHYIR